MAKTATRVILGVSGASGAALAMRIAERLAALANVELHLILSDAARKTLIHEIATDAPQRIEALAARSYPVDGIEAAIASGSFACAGMIIAPCSMRSLAAIAHGMSDNLLTRAADVQLKERRRLVLLTRETPLHLGHLRNMVSVTEMGAIIMPPVPAFYQRPQTIDQMIDHLACRAIDLLGIGAPSMTPAWDNALLDARPFAEA